MRSVESADTETQSELPLVAPTPRTVQADASRHWLDAERTRLAYDRANTSLVVDALLACALTGLLWSAWPSGMLSLWLPGLLTVAAGRAWLVRACEEARPDPSELPRWRRWLVVGSTLSALTWGIAGVHMAYHLSIGYQALLFFVLAGTAASALPALATLFRAYVLFLSALLLPIAIWLLWQRTHLSLALGCTAAVFIAAMTALACSYQRSLVNALRLTHQNSRLIDCLSRAHSVAACAIKSLRMEITERECAETAVRDSELRFRDFAELGADLFWELDTGLRYVRVLGHCEEVLGVPATALIGKPAADLGWSQIDDPQRREAHLSLVAARQPFTDYQYQFDRPDGTTVVLSSSGKPTYTANGVYIGYRGVARNITEAHSLSAKLRYQATHDALTGLYNRRELERRLKRIIDAADADGSEHALCILDMDQFKVVNDTCGHTAGDELLRQLAQLFKTQVRGRDTLARLGGDEFALLLEHCTLDQADRAVRGLREAVSEHRFESLGRAFQLGASIGVVPVRRYGGDPEQVMSAADSACYAAKEAGRNRIYVCRDGDELLRKRQGEMQWVSKITRALEQNRFCLYAQPIVPIRPQVRAKESVQLLLVDTAAIEAPMSNTGRHFEVLLRLYDERGETVLPAAFLPSAEQYNLSPRLDRWVVRSTFDWLAGNRQLLEDLALCFINLSGNSLGDDEFGMFVTAEVERTAVPAAKICFEITETAAISRIASATQLINTLKRNGFKFALDDFGSGLSSFGYLKRLPVDYVKIDGLFVRDITNNPIDCAMVKSINEIGQVMGKKTIAEFVENEAILTKLGEIGVDYAQGYAVGEPRPIGQLQLTPPASA